jgi:PAS domain S-box-containing protein
VETKKHTSSVSRVPSRLPWGLIILCVSILGMLWAALIYDARRSEDAAIAQARRDAINLAMAFREHIQRTVSEIDHLLITIIAQQPDTPDGYWIPPWVDKSPLLQGMAVQVGIAGPDGIVRDSNLGVSGRVDLSDRPHFRHHIDASASQPYISVPVLGRVSGKWSIQITRRISGDDGSFRGMVVVSVDPQYFSNFFDSVDLGAHGAAMLVGRDGIVRARRDMKGRNAGQDISSTPSFAELWASDTGSYLATSTIDGTERIVGYAVVPRYPLIVGVGLGRDDVLAPLYHQRNVHYAVGALLSIIIIAMTFFLVRESERRRRREMASQAEDILREQTLLRDAALDNMRDGLVMFDRENRVVVVNHRYIEMYGLSPDEAKPGCDLRSLLVQRRAAGTFDGDADDYIRDQVADGLIENTLVDLPDGRTISIANRPLAEGGWVSTHQDITAQRQAENTAALAQAEAGAAHRRLLDAFEVVPEGLALFDAEDRYVLWNRRYLEFYPESAAHIQVGKRFEDAVRGGLAVGQYPDAIGREEEWVAERLALHTDTQSSHEQHLPSDRWLRVEERRTSDGGSIGVRIDITDLKQREASYRLLLQERDRSRELLDRVFESVPTAIFVKEARERRFVLVNPAGEKLFGLPRAEIIGKTSEEILPATTNKIVAEHDRQLLQSDSLLVLPDHTMLTPRNGERMVTLRRQSVRDSDGMPQYLLTFLDDITDRKAVDAQLRQAQKMEAVGNMTGGLAHDFNNLLTVIIGNLDLLHDEVVGNDEAEQCRANILHSAERGADLTRQMLAFSRRQPLRSRPVDVNALVRDAARLLERTLGETITVKLHLMGGLRPALVDESQLETALVNIAINARDAMPNGGTLTLETCRAKLDAAYAAQHPDVTAGDYDCVAISDTGTGMPPEVAERIFEPFFTTKDAGKGTGLGLSMVYGFVKQSGGHITVYSELGKGTTFKLFLPLAAPEKADVNAANGEAHTLAQAAGGEIILAVDDNPSVRATVVRQLRGLGYGVREADGPQAALDILEGGDDIHLLFTDMVMPGGINGKELATKAREKRPDLKVLFTSGFPGASLTDSGALDACDVLLSKPYRKHELAKALQEMLHPE